MWGYKDGAGERTVDSHVRSIRRKLDPAVIRTVHGIGYALDTSSAAVRPLDFLHSIKLKLGVVIVAAVLVTVGVVRLGERLGLAAADQRLRRGGVALASSRCSRTG